MKYESDSLVLSHIRDLLRDILLLMKENALWVPPKLRDPK
jgi:hypothetical protein